MSYTSCARCWTGGPALRGTPDRSQRPVRCLRFCVVRVALSPRTKVRGCSLVQGFRGRTDVRPYIKKKTKRRCRTHSDDVARCPTPLAHGVGLGVRRYEEHLTGLRDLSGVFVCGVPCRTHRCASLHLKGTTITGSRSPRDPFGTHVPNILRMSGTGRDDPAIWY